MGKISGLKSVIFIYVIFTVLFIGAIFSAALYMTQITTIIRPDGQVANSSWPLQYAESFADNITIEEGTPTISKQGLSSLKRNQLWIQIIDADGQQVVQSDKPLEVRDSYSSNELLTLSENKQSHDHTVFVMPMTADGQEITYIIGFPVMLVKNTLFFNSDSYYGIRSIVFSILIGVVLFVLIAGLIYGIWLTKQLSKIVVSSRAIAARNYSPIKETGVFADAYRSLNQLDSEIQSSDEFRNKADRMKQEWIANITHDLKTPLSPIKGYAELLTDGLSNNSEEDIKRYGMRIVNSVTSTEQLINDLKLTYQMDSGVVPLDKRQVDLSSEVREMIIELLNQTEYADRSILYQCEENPVYVMADPMLFKRAVTNILINALIHNPVETDLVVSLEVTEEIKLSIKDDGKGISEEEMKRVFDRYYRGDRKNEKSDGSGLGLAIAKQIVELHDGSVEIQSTVNEGTIVTIYFPIKRKEN